MKIRARALCLVLSLATTPLRASEVDVFGDRRIRDWSQSHQAAALDRLADTGQFLGTSFALLPLTSGLWAVGDLYLKPELSRAGRNALESLTLSTIATVGLKYFVHRERPEENPSGPFVFHGPSFQTKHLSFPSGHTTAAFSVATSLSLSTSEEWVPWVAYPLAVLVGWSRIYDNKHWFSDTLAGAGVGIASAYVVEAFNREPPNGRARVGWTLVPVASPDRVDLIFSQSF